MIYLNWNKKCALARPHFQKKTDMIDTPCPNCGTPLSDEDADLIKGIVHCSSCHTELSLLEAVFKVNDINYKRIRHTVEGISFREGKHHLTLNITPKASAISWLYFFWGFFLTGSTSLLFFTVPSNIVTHFFGYIVLIILFGCGILAFLRGIKRLCVHTRIKVDKQSIVFSYNLFGSLRIWSKKIEVKKVKQFFTTNYPGSDSASSMLNRFSQVKALLQDGARVSVVSDLKTHSSAFFIEEQLESYLGVKDWVVPEEHRP
jgi:hypothetical protein